VAVNVKVEGENKKFAKCKKVFESKSRKVPKRNNNRILAVL
jgi:hypothetical protein